MTKFIKFCTTNKKTVYVNPASISSIEMIDDETLSIHCSGMWYVTRDLEILDILNKKSHCDMTNLEAVLKRLCTTLEYLPNKFPSSIRLKI